MVEDKIERVYHYATRMAEEVEILCHSCGVDEPRKLQRDHARIVRENGLSVSLADLFPDQHVHAKYQT